jgi:hypothetical protein
LHWIGLPYLRDGEQQWFDLAARPVDVSAPAPRPHPCAFDMGSIPQDALS